MKKNFLLLANRDSEGGASEWFYNLSLALKKADFEVILLVSNKRKPDTFILELPFFYKKKSIYKRILNYICRLIGLKTTELKTITKPEYSFFSGEDESKIYVTANEILNKIPFNPDIIITGLTFEFINTQTLYDLYKKTNAAVYLTAFDMSVFTGGCHVVNECSGFTKDCTKCPGIVQGEMSGTNKNLLLKQTKISEAGFGLLYGSPWGLYQANKSLIFKDALKVYIGNIVNTQLYNADNRAIAKRVFGFDDTKKIIFAGSDNVKEKRKGQVYLSEALSLLYASLNEAERESVVVVVAGNNNEENSLTKSIPFKKELIKFISDTRLLSLLYQASDVFVNTSVEDLGPAMVGEALACGTPVVGFEMGLLFDESIVKNKYNGFRAKIKDSQSLAEGIEYFLKLSKSEFEVVSNHARDSVLKNASEDFFISVMRNL